MFDITKNVHHGDSNKAADIQVNAHDAFRE